MNDPHRELCRRQHRILGAYLALYAWLKGLDCVVLNRSHLESFLGLQRFKMARLVWLWTDIKPWFPFTEELWYLGGLSDSIASVFLSRVPLDDCVPTGKMHIEDRILKMPKNAPRTALFSLKESKLWKPGLFPTETEIVAVLAKVAAGLEEPNLDKLKGKQPLRRSLF